MIRLRNELSSIKINKPKVKNIKHEWIRATGTKVIELIEKEVKVFNEANPDLKLNSNDVIGAINTVLNRLLKAMGKLPPLS
jgi:hypothetical protein